MEACRTDRVGADACRALMPPCLPACLQLFVEGVDLTVQRHAIFVDGDGQQRQGLTAQEMQQVV